MVGLGEEGTTQIFDVVQLDEEVLGSACSCRDVVNNNLPPKLALKVGLIEHRIANGADGIDEDDFKG